MDRKSTKHKGGDFCYLFLEHEDVFDIGKAKRKLERLQFSKFEVPVVVNLKHIFELLGLNTTCFLI